MVSTLAGSTYGYTDGTGTSAKFNYPFGVAVDGAGNVYVADQGNHRIRKITTSGVVSTLAGSTYGYTDGTGTSAKFNYPFGVAVDGAGNVYVADQSNHRIRKITTSGVVSTLAGSTQGYTDGTGTSAQFSYPRGVAVDGAGNVYVADRYNHRIRKITASGVVSTLAGSSQGYTDGTGTSAKFDYPSGVAVDGAGNVYVADRSNNRIRKITLSAGSAETTETITANVCDSYTSPSGKTWTTSNTYSDTIANTAGCDSVITVNLTVRNKTTETITANVCDTYTSPSGRHTWFGTGIYKDTIPNAAGCDSILTINLTVIATPIVTVSTLAGSTQGFTDGTGTSAKFYNPTRVAVDGAGNVYVADLSNHRIRKITTSGVVSTLAGSGTSGYTDGTGTSAQFNSPTGVAVDGAGNVYVADQGNHRIRKITTSGVVSTLAGSTYGYTDGTGTSAKFYNPFGVAVDGAGNVYVADQGNHRIRKITESGVVSTLAGSTYGYTDGTGTSAKFAYPFGVAVDGAGNVYVADYNNQRIRKITASGVVSTLAGSTYGYRDGTGTSAQFAYPFGVAVDGAGNVYVADESNHRIRKITASGVVSTLAGSGTSGNADGTGTSAKFKNPTGVAVDGAGNVYVGDYNNHSIRKITLSAGSAETTETITANVCDSYTSPSGKTWTTSNTYSDTIANTAGCDSVITVNLTVRNKSFATISPDVCDSYISPSGKTWTVSNTYLDTIPNAVSCDSIITVNLTIRQKSFATLTISACDTFTSPSGKKWYTSDVYLDTISNDASCDSIMTFNITIENLSNMSLSISLDSNVSCYGLSNGGATATAVYAAGTAIDTIIFENFEATSGATYSSNTSAINNLSGWSYSKSGTYARLRTNSGQYHSGSRSMALDVSSDGNYGTNYLVYQLDLGAYASTSGLGVSFWYRDFSDESDSPDKVWIRGSSSSSWIAVFDWSTPNLNRWAFKSVDIEAILASNSQTATSTFQIRFGQHDDFSIPTDGLAIDDLTFFADNSTTTFDYYWSNGGTDSTITGVTADTYTVQATSFGGCVLKDSITITEPPLSTGSEVVTAYETYNSPSGKTWTTSGVRNDTIINSIGCDSIITVDLTVINKLFVDTDGSSGTGKSWGNPMKTLDDAINAANKTDNHAEIWMRKGMYYPGGKSSSNRDSAFLL